jgi:hypothetical protein
MPKKLKKTPLDRYWERDWNSPPTYQFKYVSHTLDGIMGDFIEVLILKQGSVKR